jgi:hypothetical protein
VSRKDPSMTEERWDYIKHLKPSPGRWLVLHPLGRAGRPAVKPKTLESMLNLSKRQARKMRKRANNYLRAI